MENTVTSDVLYEKKAEKWINRQRILVFASPGISHIDRHLMKDLLSMMPHSRYGSKMEKKKKLFELNEICKSENCNKCILFEGRLRRDLYMWISNIKGGPSAKFLVESVFTLREMRLTGNCLKGSRPLLSFDENFNKYPHYAVLKELFIQVFGVPRYHPKSHPFVDHVITFSVLDNRIWFRNYQVLAEDGALIEIGPRFSLNPIKIFNDSFGGDTLWTNPTYISPAKYRQQLKKAAGEKYVSKKIAKEVKLETKAQCAESYATNPTDLVFSAEVPEEINEAFKKVPFTSLTTEEKKRELTKREILRMKQKLILKAQAKEQMKKELKKKKGGKLKLKKKNVKKNQKAKSQKAQAAKNAKKSTAKKTGKNRKPLKSK